MILICRYPYNFSKQQQYIRVKCEEALCTLFPYISPSLRDVFYDTCPIYQYIYTDLKRGWGTRFCFARPFRHGGGAGERVLLAATAASSCEASTVLEEPLGRSGKKLLGERKIEPTSMRGASDDLLPVSIHGAICMYVYRCGWSSCGDAVRWRGGSAHHRYQR